MAGAEALVEDSVEGRVLTIAERASEASGMVELL